MDITQPEFIPVPWAANGQKASIPEEQTSAGNGRASWKTGFPTENTLPVSQGGVPANYQDFQGVLYSLSENVCYQQAGGMFTWDATIDYQNGARVLGSDGKAYISTGKTGPSTTVVNPVGDTSGKWLLDANMAQVSSAASAITQDYVTSGGYTISGDVTVTGTVNGGGLVHIAGAETISGTKTFTDTISGTITDATSAGQATKLTTARTVQTDLGATTSATFDGTANITPGVTGTLAVANGGTGVTAIADIQAGKDGDGNTITSTYVDKTTYEAEMAEKADINGYYSDMTVGNAEQLISDDYTTNDTPYVFRTAGGGVDVGDREFDKLVGGTIVWNQLITDGDFPDDTYWVVRSGSTLSIADGVATVTTDEDTTYTTINLRSGKKFTLFEGHRYFVSAVVSSSSGKVVFYPGSVTSAGGKQFNGNTTPTRCSWIYTPSSTSANATGQIRFLATNISIAESISGTASNYVIFDLTQMFGTAIADYLNALDTATPGAAEAWLKKLFPKDYYAYNAGELMSVQAASHDMVGFNQWDEEWEQGTINVSTGIPSSNDVRIRSKNFIPIVADQTYYFKATVGTMVLYFYDANKKYLGSPSASRANQTYTPATAFPNAAYLKFVNNTGTGTFPEGEMICINLSHTGYRNGEYEPYEKHSYPLDSTLTLRGVPTLDSSNNLIYDGDIYASDGTVTRRYASVDLGTLSWNVYSSGGTPARFTTSGISSTIKTYESTTNVVGNMVCPPYTTVAYANRNSYDNCIFLIGTSLAVIDSAKLASMTVDEFKSAMSGVYLVYELDTPTTETADAFQSPQIVSDFGTEEYVDAAVAAGTRDVSIPVGHETKYIANLVDKLRRLPDAPDAGGNYLVHYDSTTRRASYIAYIGPTELPDAPASNGTYTLKATVADGVVTYSWEA